MITINIKTKTWEELNKRKRAGETFDEVINRILLEIPKIRGKK
jgi:predicted CopG family antitoxin